MKPADADFERDHNPYAVGKQLELPEPEPDKRIQLQPLIRVIAWGHTVLFFLGAFSLLVGFVMSLYFRDPLGAVICAMTILPLFLAGMIFRRQMNQPRQRIEQRHSRMMLTMTIAPLAVVVPVIVLEYSKRGQLDFAEGGLLMTSCLAAIAGTAVVRWLARNSHAVIGKP